MEDNKIIKFNKDFKKKPKAEGLSKRGYSLFNEGMCFYRQEKDLMALEKFLQAEKEGYESADMFSYIAYIYYAEKEDNELAEYYIKKAIKTDKEYGYPYRLMALLYDDKKDHENALKYNLLAEKYEYDTNAPMMRHISELYNRKSNLLKAIAYATKAIDLDSKNCYNWYFKGWIYYANNDYEKAVKFFKKAEDKGYTDTDFYFEFSYAYGELGNHKKAIEYANKYIFLDKESFSGYYRKGHSYLLMGDNDKALESFLLAEKRNAKCADMYCRMAYIYADKNQFDVALAYTDKAIKLDKHEPDAYYINAGIYSVGYYDFKKSLKNLNKAKKLYESIGDHFNEEAYTYYISAYGILGQRKKTLEAVEEALELYPDTLCFKAMRVFALQSVRKYKEANELLKEFDLDSEIDSFTLSYLVAINYNKQKHERNYDEVLKLYSRLSGSDIEDMKDVEAYCYYEKGEYEKSLQSLYEYTKQTDVRLFATGIRGEFKKYYRRLIKMFGENEERLKFITEKFGDLLKVKSSK